MYVRVSISWAVLQAPCTRSVYYTKYSLQAMPMWSVYCEVCCCIMKAVVSYFYHQSRSTRACGSGEADSDTAGSDEYSIGIIQDTVGGFCG